MTSAVPTIAALARSEFERASVDKDLLIRLYASYVDVGDTESFVEAALKSFPRGNCGLASLYLQHKLGGEVRRLTYADHPHSVLFIGPDEIIDITADQFGGPPVYVGPFKRPWAPSYSQK